MQTKRDFIDNFSRRTYLVLLICVIDVLAWNLWPRTHRRTQFCVDHWQIALLRGSLNRKMIHSLDILGLFSFQPLVAAENTDIHRLSGRNVFLALENTGNDSQFRYFALIWSQTACNIVADKTCFLNIDKNGKVTPCANECKVFGTVQSDSTPRGQDLEHSKLFKLQPPPLINPAIRAYPTLFAALMSMWPLKFVLSSSLI